MLNEDTVNVLQYATSYGVFSTSGGVVSPSAGTTTYYVRDSSAADCVDTARIVVTVHPQPLITGRDTTLCEGGSVDLSGLLNGDTINVLQYATSYGVFSTAGSVVSPSAGTTTYYVRDSSAADCVDTARVVVTVNPQPAIVGRDTTLCEGGLVDLSALLNGDTINVMEYGTSYGVFSTSGGVVSPSLGTTTYFIRDSSALTDCVDTARIVITVNTQPVITGRDTTFCEGETINLSTLLNGNPLNVLEYASVYGSFSGSGGLVSPGSGTVTYYVRDSFNLTGCVDTARIVMQVNPESVITGRDTSICDGSTIDLRSMLNGDTVNVLEYGTIYGVYGGIGSMVSPAIGTTTYYIRDSSVLTACIDTAV